MTTLKLWNRETTQELRAAILEAVGATKVPEVFHRWAVSDHLSILTYHGVVSEELPLEHSCFLQAQEFRAHMSYLNDHFDVVRLSRGVELAKSGELYRPTVAITFDDGFQNNFDVAFPILREYGFPATIFLCTGYVGTTDTPWYCRLHGGLQSTDQDSIQWRGEEISLASDGDRRLAGRILSESLKQFPQNRLLNELEGILKALNVGSAVPISSDSPFRMLDEDSIRAMCVSGLIEFGAHTRTHAILERLDTLQKREEIGGSISDVSEISGQDCTMFAFPNGKKRDYDEESLSLLRDCGISSAFTMVPGGVTEHTPALEMTRYGVGASMNRGRFRLTVHHLLPYFKCPQRLLQ